MSQVETRRAHYVLSTHWDREWHQSFQDFRYRLVHLMDNIIRGLEDGTMKGPFQTDGQAIILEDYLEVRPERRALIEKLCRERKFVVGPWYVLPDEFLVSGESLIRNIKLGRQIARDFGTVPSNAGWVCDLFGHNSQMPQIFAGFGIGAGFVWRGINDRVATLRWRGADETELLCHRFGKGGYCSYWFSVRHAADKSPAPAPGFTPAYGVDASGEGGGVDGNFEQRSEAFLKTYVAEETARTLAGPVLLFDGGDHLEWDERNYGVLSKFLSNGNGNGTNGNGVNGHHIDGVEIVHSSLDEYLDELQEFRDEIPTILEGELREPGRDPMSEDQQWVIPGVLSSRVWIKQQNALCQTLLCAWAEPFSSWAHLATGAEYPQGYLNLAWKYMLQNHPHDSICGCSVDQVHEDMKYRFSYARQIAERLTTEATNRLAASVEGDVSDGELRVCVFNPLARELDETVELTLQIPTEWPGFNEFFGFESKPSFRVFDAHGNEVAYQRLHQGKNVRVFLDTIHMPQGYGTNEVRVSLQLKLPASGYTTLTVRRAENWTRHPLTPALATSERSMENEFLLVVIESNGTLTLTDKRNNETYERLLTLEDIADIGDGWYHGQAINDSVWTSTASSSAVALVHNGAQLATFRIRTGMQIPARFEFDRMERSSDLADFVVDHFISLRPNCDRLEIETVVQNNADDHRVRVMFPSGAQAETYLADTPFDYVERPIALRADNHLYRELEVETKPQQTWTCVHDKSRGLAIVADGGLLETAIRDLPERPIALTLFRGTRRTVFTSGEPLGQLRGELRFKYWIVPTQGAPDVDKLFSLGQQIAGGVRAAQLLPRDMDFYRRETTTRLKPEASFLSVEGAVVTATQMCNDGLEIRAFNPHKREVQAKYARIPAYFSSAARVDYESNALKDGAETISNGATSLAIGSKKIVTLRVEK